MDVEPYIFSDLYGLDLLIEYSDRMILIIYTV